MDYKRWSPWIFIAFLLIIALLWLTGSRTLIGISIILLPILLFFQAYVILKAKDEPEETFDDKWYEDGDKRND